MQLVGVAAVPSADEVLHMARLEPFVAKHVRVVATPGPLHPRGGVRLDLVHRHQALGHQGHPGRHSGQPFLEGGRALRQGVEEDAVGPARRQQRDQDVELTGGSRRVPTSQG